MIPIDTDLLVLGGGTAGIAAARAASRNGLAVTLVEADRVGGPRTLLSWRVLERTVDRHVARGECLRASVWAEARAELARLAELREERLALRLGDAGVDLVHGRARFTSPHELEVASGARVRFDRAVVAVGAGAIGFDGDAPDGRRYVTADGLFGLSALPDAVLVVGGGAAGAELVDSLSRVKDVEVTWLMDEVGILPRFERELADALGDVLLGRGVKLVHGKAVVGVTVEEHRAVAHLEGGHKYDGPLLVACAGRRAEPTELGLDALGIASLRVDDRLRTSAEHVWAAGESAGECPSAGHAEAMGRLAGRAAAGLEIRPWDPSQIPSVVRTHPQLAQVGLTPERLAGMEVILHTARAEESLAGLLEGVGESADKKGFLRLASDSETGRILGLSAAGPGAGSLASAAAIALRLGATDDAVADVFGDVPGALDGLFAVVR
ncbi:MAG: NAD(P)/FAD-dependent oxidoreductase [Sandaracinaceae bacterium]|nr:NAD(P)/FAD-dependent oxidoreductase [Sandaracinaceae bacterium]